MTYVWPEFPTLFSGLKKIRANLHVHFLQPCFGCQQSQVCAVWVLDTPKLCLQHLLLFGTESHNTDIGVLWGQLGRHRLQHLRTNQKCCISYVKLLTHNFRRIRKMAKSGYWLRHVCPTVRMKQLGSHSTDFHVIWCLSVFRKAVPKTLDSLKSGKNDWYFTWRPKYIWSYLAQFFLEWEVLQTKIIEKTKRHLLWAVTFFF